MDNQSAGAVQEIGQIGTLNWFSNTASSRP
jgi:hypothetical protein